MTYPTLIRQPNWVLQSASADREDPNQLNAKPCNTALHAWELIKPGWDAFQKGDVKNAKQFWKQAIERQPRNLLLMRAINRYTPELLVQDHVSRLGRPWGSRIAVVIPGELRCYRHSVKFFKSLGPHTDIFICTSKAFANATGQLPVSKVKVIDQEPNHPTGAMQQWHKLAVALSMVRSHENRIKRRYTHIVKLRSDFHHVQPRHLLHELVSADGLICSSDKVFGGRREIMMLFEGFYAAIYGWFDEQEERYWPINIDTILNSDDSCKWYGMNFPKKLVGQPKTVEDLREILSSGGEDLAKSLQQWRPDDNSSMQNQYSKQLHRLVPGHPRFASEICFARFLNFNGIRTQNSPGMLGFLRSDRHSG